MVSWPIPCGKSGCDSVLDDGEKAAQVSATMIWARFQKQTVRWECDQCAYMQQVRRMLYTDLGVPRTRAHPGRTGTYPSPSAQVVAPCRCCRTGAGTPRRIPGMNHRNPKICAARPSNSICLNCNKNATKPMLTAQRTAPTSRMMAMRSGKSGMSSLAWGATRKTCSMRLSGQRSSSA